MNISTNIILYFVFYFSVITGRMESHAQIFRRLLKTEATKLDEARILRRHCQAELRARQADVLYDAPGSRVGLNVLHEKLCLLKPLASILNLPFRLRKLLQLLWRARQRGRPALDLGHEGRVVPGGDAYPSTGVGGQPRGQRREGEERRCILRQEGPPSSD